MKLFTPYKGNQIASHTHTHTHIYIYIYIYIYVCVCVCVRVCVDRPTEISNSCREENFLF